jgi:hypothetical protein
VEDAITGLWRQAGIYDMGKGTEWGQLLAEWAFNNPRIEIPRTDILQLNEDHRPVTQLIVMLMKARKADYDLTLAHHSKDLLSAKTFTPIKE